MSMNNIHLSEEAQNDLVEIKAYIEEELLNPSAALGTVSKITKSLRILRTYAQAGAPLSSVTDIESDYRFIVSGNYISFYRAYGIQTVDQLKAIKTIKGKISDIGKMKVEEQRKAVRAGYDPDILPPDLITFSKDAAELLADLQSRNERMFLLTFTVVNMAPTRQRLENDVFTVGGIAQKYNCALKRLDWQQEQGFVSSLALGYNEVEIQRGMTTSSTAIFIPFMTRELRMDGQALYAAFHDEGDHPHVHMMAWSAKPGQAYLSRDGIRQIKSELTNDIFKQELLHLYEQKSDSRDELVQEARKVMLELAQTMSAGIPDHPEAERLILELAMQLETVKGKKSYGYLPKSQKKLVDKIVDEMERLPSVRDCYDQWLILQGKVDGYYHNKERKHVPLSQQKEFRSIKNAVIREAENIRQCNLFFEDKGVEQESEPEEFRNASYDYENLRDAIRNESLTLEERGDAVDEMNKLAKSGDKYAQYLMGKLWRDGPLLTPDWVNARYWFQKSAEQGHTYAQYALGNSSEQKLILVFMSISYRGLCVMEIPDIHSP